MKPSIYQALGKEKITQIITEFYQLAFQDPIIGHFFFRKDHDELLRGQLAFTLAMLGGEEAYRGRDVAAIHSHLAIRPPHFNRRQQLLKDILVKHAVDAAISSRWLRMEERLRQAIIGFVA
ncbi:MAG: group 1 truncated hemoglobin [Pseudomonadota bacterium]|nr:group 1 truncated hemoglobin [Pseudomonadota bacterium]